MLANNTYRVKKSQVDLIETAKENGIEIPDPSDWELYNLPVVEGDGNHGAFKSFKKMAQMIQEEG